MQKEKWEEYQIDVDHFYEVMQQKTQHPKGEENNETPQQMFGVTTPVLDRYYRTALKFLENKNWENARDAFMFLTFLNPYVHDFWVGLGIAEQSQSHFDKALQAYTLAEATDPEDPIPIANAFQCILALGEKDYAQYTLDKALARCGDNEVFAGLKSQLLQHKVA